MLRSSLDRRRPDGLERLLLLPLGLLGMRMSLMMSLMLYLCLLSLGRLRVLALLPLGLLRSMLGMRMSLMMSLMLYLCLLSLGRLRELALLHLRWCESESEGRGAY